MIYESWSSEESSWACGDWERRWFREISRMVSMAVSMFMGFPLSLDSEMGNQRRRTMESSEDSSVLRCSRRVRVRTRPSISS